MRGDVVDTDMSGKLIKNDTDNVDRENDVVYINGIDYGDNPMTFQFDTTGYVPPSLTTTPPLLFDFQWSDLSPFAQGCIEALFAAAWAEPKFRSDWLLRDVVKGAPEEEWRHERPAFSDLAPETLARIIADCEALVLCFHAGGGATVDDGRLMWRDRQSANFEGFPPLTVQLGDDGKVRFA